jgi:hypothetical protein
MQPNTITFLRALHLQFLLMKTCSHEWSRLVKPCKELLYIIGNNLYTVSKASFDAT